MDIENLPAVQGPWEMWFQSLGWEVPLEDSMATHCSKYSCLEYLIGRRVWRATVHRVAELDTTEATEQENTVMRSLDIRTFLTHTGEK